MRKLEVMRNNIQRFKAQREQRLTDEKPIHPEILSRPIGEDYSLSDRVLAPPYNLIYCYYSNTHEFAKQHILGDSSLTREQQRDMLEEHLLGLWKAQKTSEALGCSNRYSDWKPSVKCGMAGLEIYLNRTLVMSLS
jgi:hypothetical protein